MMGHVTGVLVIGNKRLVDVCFNCALCGPRYWQVEEPTTPYTDEDMLREAVRQEAEWHQQNIERYGWPTPVGIEPHWRVALRADL
jgi:hypothetical protein